MKFEEALKKLEKIVEDLETGEISLDHSIQKFEEGMSLVKICSGKLREVEKKIETVLKDKKGKITKKPFKTDEKTEMDADETEDSSNDEESDEELLF